MRTDVHFICEKCGNDYRNEAAKAEACEAAHPDVETTKIIGMKRFAPTSTAAHGAPQVVTLEWRRPDGRLIRADYQRENNATKDVTDES